MDKKFREKKLEILAELAEKYFPDTKIKKGSIIKRIRIVSKGLIASIYPNGIIDLYSEEHYKTAVEFAEEYEKIFKEKIDLDTHYGF